MCQPGRRERRQLQTMRAAARRLVLRQASSDGEDVDFQRGRAERGEGGSPSGPEWCHRGCGFRT